jgi:tricorn protease-like protein
MNRVIMKISLLHFPVQMMPLDTATIMKKYPNAPFTETAVAVGTREGKVMVFNVEANESSCVIKTKAGVMFGEVRGLSVQDDGS